MNQFTLLIPVEQNKSDRRRPVGRHEVQRPKVGSGCRNLQWRHYRVGDTRGGNWGCYPSIFSSSTWRPF